MAKAKKEEVVLGGEAIVSPQDFPGMKPFADFAKKDRERLLRPPRMWGRVVLVIILAILAGATVDWDHALGVRPIHRTTPASAAGK